MKYDKHLGVDMMVIINTTISAECDLGTQKVCLIKWCGKPSLQMKLGKDKNCNSCKCYKEFSVRHNCLLNHKGSSGSMASDDIVECFKTLFTLMSYDIQHISGMVTSSRILMLS